MKKRLWLAVLLCLALLSQVALASENLIANGDISDVDTNGLARGWSRTMWDRDEGISELDVSRDAVSGEHALHIVNLGENDARFYQTIKVKPDACYLISARVKALGCDPDYAGAGLSIDNTFVTSELVYDTNGAWRELSFYGRTGENQKEITLLARLGGYGSLNVGEAWFDDVSVIEVSEEEAGGDVMSLATIPPSGGYEAPDAPRETPWAALFVIVALIYAAAAAGVLLYNARSKSPLAQPASPVRVFLTVAAVALAVRVVLAMLVRGFKVDMNCFEGWASHMASVGPTGFYTPAMFCDYPPGYLYVLWLKGSVIRLIGVTGDGPLTWLIIKLAPILMDVTAALVVWRVARQSLDERASLLLAALVAFNPAAIFISSAWGQVDSVLTVLLVLSMLNASRGRWFAALPLFAVAVLVKPQALMLAPLGLVMLAVEVVESEEKGKLALRLLGAVLLGFATFALLALPFLIKIPEEILPTALSFGVLGYRIEILLPSFLRPLGYLFELYFGTIGQYAYATVNALNLYMLMGLNWTSLATVPAVKLFSYVLMGASIAYSVFLYARAKDRGKVFLVGAMTLTMLFAVAPMMHERYLFPALLLLIMAYAFDRDARLLIAFVALSVTQFVNVALVLKYEYLMVEGQEALYGAVSLVNVLAAAFLGWTGWEMCVAGRLISFTRVYKPSIVKEKTASRQTQVQEALLKPRDPRLLLKRRDWFFMILLTLVYAAVSFANLGSAKAPQTQWKSTAAGEQVTFDLGEIQTFHMTYYGGISNSSFLVQMSDDQQVWSEPHYAEYEAGLMYRWLWYSAGERDSSGQYYSIEDENHPYKTARYVRLTAERPGLLLNEVAFIDGDGSPLHIASVYSLGGGNSASDPTKLIDEQKTVPPYPSYYNGMYFDEIYHGRTAYEHLKGLSPYEGTHPPLAKVLIMLGIKAFGMTPFGWRFVPALFGVLMVPLMYLLAKQLFKKSTLALIGAFLLAVDCMHFTQSRFATLDAIAVFFIMLMYLFMIRYAFMSFYHQKLGRTLVPLGLSGVTMGVAVACKWIGLYAAIGLGFIFFFTLFQRYREYRYAKKNLRTLDVDGRRVAQRAVKTFSRNAVLTLLFCLVFFIAVPLVIYYFSYYWHLAPEGGLSIERVWQIQKSMLSYHQGSLEHGFASPFYEWPLIVRPMWFYTGSEYLERGMVSTISCMGNPVVWWGGLIAIIWVAARLAINNRGDRRYLFIVVGYMSQYVPWFFIFRSTFIYHYFASVPFIILATVAAFEWVRKKSMRAYKIAALCYCGAALLMFTLFFPIISGVKAPKAYTRYLKWFNWVNQ